MLRTKIESEVANIKLLFAISTHTLELIWLQLVDSNLARDNIDARINEGLIGDGASGKRAMIGATGDEGARRD